ncbi:MAG: UDP-N-acetylmuramoyl-tripeptide--D-alanyl-D-alanine ligase [[Eubacterium] sulci]|nr:UDP-N-acetylmuramoyl-tripeptide--D-alanyl-D-alanine ligase [[Eubacterium] sulci]
MEELRARQIADAVKGKLIRGSIDEAATDICIDSRNAKSGDLFCAMGGEFNDGHKFMKSAYDNGCRIMLISKEETAETVPEDCALILTDDAMYALQELSAWYIARFDMKKLAVTGSVGKTTTRDMIYAILKKGFNAGTSKANLNSETGLPITLLSFDGSMDAVVVEMGMDALGQISRLTEIAKPDVAVITNIGYSHLEKLGTRENIFKAKMEIVEGFDESKILVVNADDDMLETIDEDKVPYRIIRAGKAENADVRVLAVENLGYDGIAFDLVCEGEKHHVKLGIMGEHNAINAALAAAACKSIGMNFDDIIAGLQDIEMTGSRLRFVEAGEVNIIDDAYNAAPESMISALKTLVKSEGKRKLAVLAGMNELGAVREESHRRVGREAAKLDLDLMITVGSDASLIAEEAASEGMDKNKMLHFDSRDALADVINDYLKAGDLVLLKASRSYELEKLIDSINK